MSLNCCYYYSVIVILLCSIVEWNVVQSEKMGSSAWPFVVKISESHGKGHGSNSSKAHCAGTLISDKFVLTAAECVKGKPSSYMVELPSMSGKSQRVSKVTIEKEFKNLALLKLAKGVPKFKNYASLFLSSCKLRSEKCEIFALDERNPKQMEQVPFTIELCKEHVKEKGNNAVFANVCSDKGDGHCNKHLLGSPLFCPVGKGYSQFGVLHSKKCQFGMIRYYSLWILNTLESN